MPDFCLGCMRPKTNHPVCEHCGFDERQDNLPHQLPVGTVLQGQYLVGKVLGQGGFGITYMGWDQNLSVPVAIKEYFPGGVVQRHTQLGTGVTCANGDTEEAYGRYRDRFLKEARTLAQLARFPEIVQIKSYFSDNNTAYIVMEYVQGVTLKSCLKNMGRPMTEKEALEIMQPALKALQKIHHCGVIHRDISPDNIMIHNGGIKLIDFGTVRYMDNEGHSQSTEAILKPGFAPMEQYNTRGNLGTWTDVYAICACFHYLLTGSVPPDVHERLDEGEALTQLRNRGGISANTIEALEKGMRIRHQERLQTIDELYSLLYAPKPKVQEKPEKKVTPAAKPVPKKQKKQPKGLAVLAAAAVATAAVCGLLLVPEQEQTKQEMAAPEAAVTEQVPETAESLSPEGIAYAEAEALLAAGETGKAAIAFGKLGDYSDARQRSFALWDETVERKTIFADNGHLGYGTFTYFGLKADGTIAGHHFGGNLPIWEEVYGWTDIVDLSYRDQGMILGLKEDGTVLSAGYDNYYGELDVSGWTDIVEVCAEGYWEPNAEYDKVDGKWIELGNDKYYSVGLKSDGTVVATGNNQFGQCEVSDWTDIVAITTYTYREESYLKYRNGGLRDVYSYSRTFGIRADGTVVMTGKDLDNWCDLSGWTDIIAISVSDCHVAGLKSDGTVVTVGYDPSIGDIDSDRLNVSEWKNVKEIHTNFYSTSAITVDGTFLFAGNWGRHDFGGRYAERTEWTDIISVQSADYNTLGLKSDGTVIYWGGPNDNVSQWRDIVSICCSESLSLGLKADGTVVSASYRDGSPTWSGIALPGQRKLKAPENKQEAPSTDKQAQYEAAENLLAQGETAKAAIAFGKLGDYQDARQRSFGLWREVIPQQTISAGYNNTAAVKEDGTVLIVGANDVGQLNAREWKGLSEISVNVNRVVGLGSDGTVQSIGGGSETVSGWKNMIAIETSGNSTVGIQSDGSVAGVGCDDSVLTWTDIVAIGEHHYNTIGLKSDGTVVTASEDGHDYGMDAQVSAWCDIVSVGAGLDFVVGLKEDRTVVTAGDFQTSVSDWRDIQAISAGQLFIAGLKNDGTVVVAAKNPKMSKDFDTSQWKNIVAISAGQGHLVALKDDGTMVSAGFEQFGIFQSAEDWTDIRLPN